jgi:hypothetical protein
LAAALKSASGSIMDVEVNDDVNIGVPELLDFLSDAPALAPLTTPIVPRAPPRPNASVSSAPKVFTVEADIVF